MIIQRFCKINTDDTQMMEFYFNTVCWRQTKNFHTLVVLFSLRIKFDSEKIKASDQN